MLIKYANRSQFINHSEIDPQLLNTLANEKIGSEDVYIVVEAAKYITQKKYTSIPNLLIQANTLLKYILLKMCPFCEAYSKSIESSIYGPQQQKLENMFKMLLRCVNTLIKKCRYECYSTYKIELDHLINFEKLYLMTNDLELQIQICELNMIAEMDNNLFERKICEIFNKFDKASFVNLQYTPKYVRSGSDFSIQKIRYMNYDQQIIDFEDIEYQKNCYISLKRYLAEQQTSSTFKFFLAVYKYYHYFKGEEALTRQLCLLKILYEENIMEQYNSNCIFRYQLQLLPLSAHTLEKVTWQYNQNSHYMNEVQTDVNLKFYEEYLQKQIGDQLTEQHISDIGCKLILVENLCKLKNKFQKGWYDQTKLRITQKFYSFFIRYVDAKHVNIHLQRIQKIIQHLNLIDHHLMTQLFQKLLQIRPNTKRDGSLVKFLINNVLNYTLKEHMQKQNWLVDLYQSNKELFKYLTRTNKYKVRFVQGEELIFKTLLKQNAYFINEGLLATMLKYFCSKDLFKQEFRGYFDQWLILCGQQTLDLLKYGIYSNLREMIKAIHKHLSKLQNQIATYIDKLALLNIPLYSVVYQQYQQILSLFVRSAYKTVFNEQINEGELESSLMEIKSLTNYSIFYQQYLRMQEISQVDIEVYLRAIEGFVSKSDQRDILYSTANTHPKNRLRLAICESIVTKVYSIEQYQEHLFTNLVLRQIYYCSYNNLESKCKESLVFMVTQFMKISQYFQDSILVYYSSFIERLNQISSQKQKINFRFEFMQKITYVREIFSNELLNHQNDDLRISIIRQFEREDSIKDLFSLCEDQAYNLIFKDQPLIQKKQGNDSQLFMELLTQFIRNKSYLLLFTERSCKIWLTLMLNMKNQLMLYKQEMKDPEAYYFLSTLNDLLFEELKYKVDSLKDLSSRPYVKLLLQNIWLYLGNIQFQEIANLLKLVYTNIVQQKYSYDTYHAVDVQVIDKLDFEDATKFKLELKRFKQFDLAEYQTMLYGSIAKFLACLDMQCLNEFINMIRFLNLKFKQVQKSINPYSKAGTIVQRMNVLLWAYVINKQLFETELTEIFQHSQFADMKICGPLVNQILNSFDICSLKQLRNHYSLKLQASRHSKQNTKAFKVRIDNAVKMYIYVVVALKSKHQNSPEQNFTGLIDNLSNETVILVLKFLEVKSLAYHNRITAMIQNAKQASKQYEYVPCSVLEIKQLVPTFQHKLLFRRLAFSDRKKFSQSQQLYLAIIEIIKKYPGMLIDLFAQDHQEYFENSGKCLNFLVEIAPILILVLPQTYSSCVQMLFTKFKSINLDKSLKGYQQFATNIEILVSYIDNLFVILNSNLHESSLKLYKQLKCVIEAIYAIDLQKSMKFRVFNKAKVQKLVESALKCQIKILVYNKFGVYNVQVPSKTNLTKLNQKCCQSKKLQKNMRQIAKTQIECDLLKELDLLQVDKTIEKPFELNQKQINDSFPTYIPVKYEPNEIEENFKSELAQSLNSLDLKVSTDEFIKFFNVNKDEMANLLCYKYDFLKNLKQFLRTKLRALRLKFKTSQIEAEIYQLNQQIHQNQNIKNIIQMIDLVNYGQKSFAFLILSKLLKTLSIEQPLRTKMNQYLSTLGYDIIESRVLQTQQINELVIPDSIGEQLKEQQKVSMIVEEQKKQEIIEQINKSELPNQQTKIIQQKPQEQQKSQSLLDQYFSSIEFSESLQQLSDAVIEYYCYLQVNQQIDEVLYLSYKNTLRLASLTWKLLVSIVDNENDFEVFKDFNHTKQDLLKKILNRLSKEQNFTLCFIDNLTTHYQLQIIGMNGLQIQPTKPPLKLSFQTVGCLKNQQYRNIFNLLERFENYSFQIQQVLLYQYQRFLCELILKEEVLFQNPNIKDTFLRSLRTLILIESKDTRYLDNNYELERYKQVLTPAELLEIAETIVRQSIGRVVDQLNNIWVYGQNIYQILDDKREVFQGSYLSQLFENNIIINQNIASLLNSNYDLVLQYVQHFIELWTRYKNLYKDKLDDFTPTLKFISKYFNHSVIESIKKQKEQTRQRDLVKKMFQGTDSQNVEYYGGTNSQLMNELIKILNRYKTQDLDYIEDLVLISKQYLSSITFDKKIQIYGYFNSESESATIKIRRNQIAMTTFEYFVDEEVDKIQKADYEVEFEDQLGIDGGGPYNEWIMKFFQQVLDPSYALFTETKQKYFLPSRASKSIIGYRLKFRIFGRILAKLFSQNKLSIAVPLCSYLFRLVKGEPALELEDLKQYDMELYRNLKWIQANDIEQDCIITFSEQIDSFGVIQTHEFVEQGSRRYVDNQNKHEYIRLYLRWKLIEDIQQQIFEIVLGFREIFSSLFLRYFSTTQICIFFQKQSGQLDLELYRKQVQLNNCSLNTKQVKWLFQILQQFDHAQISKYIQFLTGKRRAPTLGFKEFKIYLVYQKNTLPASATCSNKLTLGLYNSKEILREKLLMAFEQCDGFHNY